MGRQSVASKLLLLLLLRLLLLLLLQWVVSLLILTFSSIAQHSSLTEPTLLISSDFWLPAQNATLF